MIATVTRSARARKRRAWIRGERPGGPAALRAELTREEWDFFARDIQRVPTPEEALAHDVGIATTPIGTPGYVAGTQAMQLTLRTYLLAVALLRSDAARVLIHLGVATPQEIDVLDRVCVVSRLVGADSTLTGDGWEVARAMSPR